MPVLFITFGLSLALGVIRLLLRGVGSCLALIVHPVRLVVRVLALAAQTLMVMLLLLVIAFLLMHFFAGTKFESVMLTTREFQYLYNDGADYIFMDNETYEQVPVPEDMVGENSKWLRENDICQLLFADDELMGVTPPMFIETTIVQTDPGFKGDTVQGSTKPATIDTGAVIQVPMYLNEGEVIKVDTRDGKFVSRV